MRNAIARRRRCRIALILSLLMASWVGAEDGRDFAGFYEISNVTDQGEEVTLTLTVRIFNYSGADVIGATVTLQDVAGRELGAFVGTVSIRDRASVRLSGDFTVPQAEYDYWQKGGTPAVVIEYVDAGGNHRRHPVELIQMPVGEEE